MGSCVEREASGATNEHQEEVVDAPDERVPEQTGLHEAGVGVPMEGGADIDGDGTKEHSNVHLGELQWGSDPMDGESVSSPGFGIEVDFVPGDPDELLNRPGWERGIEENYALYGIEIDIVRDEVLTGDSTVETYLEDVLYSDGVSAPEFLTLHYGAYDGRGEKHLIVANKPGPEIETFRSGVWGGNWRYGVEVSGIFVEPVESMATSSTRPNVTMAQVLRSRFSSKTGYLTGFVEMHEIGHSLYIGEADDKPYAVLPIGEVYSGSGADPTPEINSGTSRWSIMRIGWSRSSEFTKEHTSYWAFSIEELTTTEDDHK